MDPGMGGEHVAVRADGLGLWLVPCLGERGGLFCCRERSAMLHPMAGPRSYSPNPQDTQQAVQHLLGEPQV